MSKGSNFGSNEIDVGHLAWSGSTTTEAFTIKPVRVEIAIEIFRSLAPSEEEEKDQYEGKESEGTSNDTTGDCSHV